MARGPSGRVVIEIDPGLKRELHSALSADGVSLKDWFLKRTQEYVSERTQPRLPGLESPFGDRSGSVKFAAEDYTAE